MSAALLLLGWVALMAWPGSAWLARHSFHDAPAVGVAVWQGISASVVAGLVLGGLALAAGSDPLSHGLARLLETCELLVKSGYEAPGGTAASSIGAVLVVVVLGRLSWSAARTVVDGARRRRAWRLGLALVADTDPATGALVVPHSQPTAYCVPGHRGTVVVTSAARDALTAAQLRAVVDHERSHLHQHHHVVVTAAAVLLDALPFLPVLRHAHRELQRLVELMADDRAATTSDRSVLAAAIGRVCPRVTDDRSEPGRRNDERVRRLTSPARALRRPVTGGILTGAAFALGAPALLFLVPVLTSAVTEQCAIAMHCA